MSSGLIEVRLEVSDETLLGDDLAGRSGMLAAELADLDVHEVGAAVDGRPPDGAKGVELAMVGAFIVKLAGSPKLLGQVVDVVRHWVTASGVDTVRMEIDGDVLEITGVSAAERGALIDAWVQRHAAT